MKTCLLGAVCAISMGSAQAATVALTPVSLGTANDNNNDGVYDELTPILEAAATGNSTHRGLIEFDLSAISGSVTYAVLRLDTSGSGGVSNASYVEFYGYAGDGSVSLADALVGDYITTQRMSGVINQLVSIDVTQFVQQLPTYAGFKLQQEDETVDIHQPFDSDPPTLPILNIIYSPVPIPLSHLPLRLRPDRVGWNGEKNTFIETGYQFRRYQC